MNVYVTLKQVPDTETKIELKNEKQINEAGIKWIINPYDEHAVEEAIRFKEKNSDAEVIVVSVGPERAQEAIRTALAMGADRGIHVVTDAYLDHGLTAKILAGAITGEGKPELVFMGKQAIDDDGFQIHLRLAELLKASGSTHLNFVEVTGNKVQVSREVGAGEQEKLELSMPAILAVDKAINKPRYPTLPNIMKAKKKEIKRLSLADTGVTEIAVQLEIMKLELPPQKSGGRIIGGEKEESVPQLAKLLKEEAHVI